MIKKILLGMTLLMAMASCTEDYTNWANPQNNPQEQAVAFGNGSVAPVDVINLADVTTETVKVASITAPTSSDEAYATAIYKLNIGDKTFDIDAEGNMTTEELANYITTQFGKRPTEHDVDATVSAWISNGSTTVKMATSETFQIKAIPAAPFIDSNYYLVGGMTDWKLDTSLKFTHSDADVYEDPVFTLMFTTTADDQYWKIIPQSNVDAGNIWEVENAPKGVVGVETDGDDAMSGTLLTTTSTGSKANAGKIAKAGMYQMTINMMDYTYTIKEIAPEYYLVGALQGWSDSNKSCILTAQTAMVQSYTTKWTGGANLKIWLGSDFGSWDASYGTATDGDNSEEGHLKVNAGAIVCPEVDAYYTFTVDFSTMTYKWTKLEDQAPKEFSAIGLIGVNGDWANDVDLEQVTPHNWYKANVEIPAGEIKIRAEHAWDQGGNWGYGDGDYENKGTLVNGSNNNIKMPAGTYNVFFNDITCAYSFIEVK